MKAGDPEEEGPLWEHLAPRDVSAEDWGRFEGSVAEIFSAFGMDLDTPGTEETPRPFLQALFDATSGYEGDAKLVTVFPTECRGGPDCRIQPDHRGTHLVLRPL